MTLRYFNSECEGGSFACFATALLEGGYSPVPIEPQEKRPVLGGWDRLRLDPLTPEEIAAIAIQHPDAGLGVAGGYNGLVPFDIDTEDPKILAAIAGVLPKSFVGKKGRRGKTWFYRDPYGLIKARKFKCASGNMLAEVLVTGQTVIPPTQHPETKKPYEWLTDSTLLNAHVDDLPHLPSDAIERLEQALKPWSPAARAPARSYAQETAGRFSEKRMRGYAKAALSGEVNRLAATPKGGRNQQLFRAACTIGRYIHHEVLSETQAKEALLEAVHRNGLLKEDGRRACEQTIMSGLRKAEGDELPVLEVQPVSAQDEMPSSSSLGEVGHKTPKRGNGARPTQVSTLIEIATVDGVELFHTADGTPYADITTTGIRETWSLRSRGFRRWLQRSFYEKTGCAPSSDALTAAMGIIEAKAHYDGIEREVHLRVANCRDRVYLDLCDPAWRAIEIRSDGWSIADSPPVRFRRTRGMLQIPDPVPGGEVKELGGLRDHLNVDDDSFVLVVAWLLAIIRGSGPYPILALTGEQGTGKSLLADMLRSLLDPRTAGLRPLPSNTRDLYVAAMNGHVLVYDNLSGISREISDCLCRLSTGGGFATRSLYTDDEEVLFDGQRPVALTSITDVASLSDLADRTMIVNLKVIHEEKRKTERELREAFDAARPRILGALLDVAAHGLLKLPTTSMNRLPRMADFALWIKACEEAVWQVGMFMGAYEVNREDAVDIVLDSDLVATALRQHMKTRLDFEGTATELLTVLNGVVSEQVRRSKLWPLNGKALSGQLKRLAPALRRAGITIEHSREGHSGRRLLTIKRGEGG